MRIRRVNTNGVCKQHVGAVRPSYPPTVFRHNGNMVP
jgi:hypothetical protein